MTADNDEIPSTDEMIDYLRRSDKWLLYERDRQPTQAVRRQAHTATVIDGVEEMTGLELVAQCAQRMTSTRVDSLIKEVRGE